MTVYYNKTRIFHGRTAGATARNAALTMVYWLTACGAAGPALAASMPKLAAVSARPHSEQAAADIDAHKARILFGLLLIGAGAGLIIKSAHSIQQRRSRARSFSSA